MQTKNCGVGTELGDTILKLQDHITHTPSMRREWKMFYQIVEEDIDVV